MPQRLIGKTIAGVDMDSAFPESRKGSVEAIRFTDGSKLVLGAYSYSEANDAHTQEEVNWAIDTVGQLPRARTAMIGRCAKKEEKKESKNKHSRFATRRD